MYSQITTYTIYYADLISERGLSLIEGADMSNHMYPKVTYHIPGDIIGSSCLLPYGHIWSVFDNLLQCNKMMESQITIHHSLCNYDLRNSVDSN